MSERSIGLPEIARVFLKIGAMSYGGPAIMGIMQAELQEKRQWISKEKFVEGLSLVNMLPGPLATQLGIYIGHEKGGMAGGILAGFCFILPAFLVMLALSAVYAAYGALPSMRDAFYGIGPVVLGIFGAAVYRLGRASIKDVSQAIIAAMTALAILASPLGFAVTLLAAGCVGVALFHSRQGGLIALTGVAVACMIVQYLDMSVLSAVEDGVVAAPGLWDLAVFFFKVGAFSFGGGLSMLAFIQEQVVNHLAWLTPHEFVDGLALGQLTPGPVLMLAAFVGFKLMGFEGAAVAAAAIFLPSFLMMLSILPLLKKLGDLKWLKAFMRGAGPAVIGALAASLGQMAPHAAPDAFTAFLLVATLAIILLRNVGPLPLIGSGALFGIVGRGSLVELLQDFVG